MKIVSKFFDQLRAKIHAWTAPPGAMTIEQVDAQLAAFSQQVIEEATERINAGLDVALERVKQIQAEALEAKARHDAAAEQLKILINSGVVRINTNAALWRARN